jgi:nicotinamide-nucleotide amidase
MPAMDNKISGVIQKIHELFKGKGLTLSVAESCTGGLISHYLTTLPGASAFFEAGVVVYSAEMKEKILGLSSSVISKHGVVSRETAEEMAEKVRAVAGTGFSIATTGNLGPDVLEGKERGLVYLAVSRNGQTFSEELHLTGDRTANKEEAALSALRFLIEIVSG